MADTRTIEIEVLRYNPEKDAKPHFQTFPVPFSHDTSVLQGLQYIKDHLDGSLTFRWSCRMAICGSCGKMVNGVPQLSCHTFLRDYYPGKVRIEPLNHFPILRDLAIDQSDFFDKKLPSVKPYIVPKDAKPVSAGTHVQTPAQFQKYYQYSQCINCLLCYAPARSTVSSRISPAPRRWPCCTATTPTRATAAGRSGRRSSTPKKGCGAARWSVTAPRCARNTWIPPTPSTRTRSTARWIISVC